MAAAHEAKRGIDQLGWQLAEYRAWLAADRGRRPYVFPATKHGRSYRDVVRAAFPGAVVVGLPRGL